MLGRDAHTSTTRSASTRTRQSRSARMLSSRGMNGQPDFCLAVLVWTPTSYELQWASEQHCMQRKHDALDRLRVDVESSLYIQRCT